MNAQSLDLRSLSDGYASGRTTPTLIVEAVLARREAASDDNVWIAQVPAAALLARARQLEALPPAQRSAMPLWGVPFAVKDNIDVAGLPTTAGCPAFAHPASADATVVARLLAAGAILVGKTNLDQFATGLVGVRSPYGVARNPFDPAYIPGGSSSGSAVAVSAGLVSFALGTDTAGSGRVPAGFTNIVGLKPTKGLISTAGVVPACRSLDCVSIFALTVEDAMAALSVAAGPDQADPFSRRAPATATALRAPFRFGVPAAERMRFFGDAAAERLHGEALARLEALGGERVEIDFAPFARAADLLYSGPWVAERTAAVGAHLESALPVTRSIIMGGATKTAVETFQALYALEECRAAAAAEWERIDVLALPTSGTIYKIADVLADPVQTNTNLGAYTNFVNLLDLCGIAVPAGFRPDGLPAGITLLAPAFREAAVAQLASRFHRATALPMGATGHPLPPPGPLDYGSRGLLRLLVVGGHLSGQPLNGQLSDVGARLVAAVRTAPVYRLYALPGHPPRPGMVRAAEGGVAIEGEIWELAPADFGRFVAAIPAPLGVGQVELDDGSLVTGFLCETLATADAQDISEFGGWRAWRART
ncbi:MAG: allophanate hydrolase [Alphaproteobacteria bacterium]|nr:allophanate hydrolase [Alphaproteobacteria bacterium]